MQLWVSLPETAGCQLHAPPPAILNLRGKRQGKDAVVWDTLIMRTISLDLKWKMVSSGRFHYRHVSRLLSTSKFSTFSPPIPVFCTLDSTTCSPTQLPLPGSLMITSLLDPHTHWPLDCFRPCWSLGSAQVLPWGRLSWLSSHLAPLLPFWLHSQLFPVGEATPQLSPSVGVPSEIWSQALVLFSLCFIPG